MKPSTKIFLMSLIATTLFVLADGLIHFFTPLKVISYRYSFLPFSPLTLYIIGKYIGTFIMFFLLLWIFSKTKIRGFARYSLITLIIVSLLELRYILDPYYGIFWHIINFISHYIELLGSIYITKLIVR